MVTEGLTVSDDGLNKPVFSISADTPLQITSSSSS